MPTKTRGGRHAESERRRFRSSFRPRTVMPCLPRRSPRSCARISTTFEIVVVDDGVGAAEFVGEWFAGERCDPLRRQRGGRPGPGAQSWRLAGAGRDRRFSRRRRPLGLEGPISLRCGRRSTEIRPRRSPRAKSSSSTTTRASSKPSRSQPRPAPRRSVSDNKILVSGFAFSRRLSAPPRPLRRDAADLLGLGLVSAPARRRRRLSRSRAAGGRDRRPSPRNLRRRPFARCAPTISRCLPPSTGSARSPCATTKASPATRRRAADRRRARDARPVTQRRQRLR